MDLRQSDAIAIMNLVFMLKFIFNFFLQYTSATIVLRSNTNESIAGVYNDCICRFQIDHDEMQYVTLRICDRDKHVSADRIDLNHLR